MNNLTTTLQSTSLDESTLIDDLLLINQEKTVLDFLEKHFPECTISTCRDTLKNKKSSHYLVFSEKPKLEHFAIAVYCKKESEIAKGLKKLLEKSEIYGSDCLYLIVFEKEICFYIKKSGHVLSTGNTTRVVGLKPFIPRWFPTYHLEGKSVYTEGIIPKYSLGKKTISFFQPFAFFMDVKKKQEEIHLWIQYFIVNRFKDKLIYDLWAINSLDRDRPRGLTK